MRHGPELLRVEATEQGVQAGRWITRWVGQSVAQKSAPHRNLLERDGLTPGAWSTHGVAGSGRIGDHAPIIARPRVT
ncbi:MAG: hypothetical protein NVS9B8_07330 [Candidatus Limnocylindrales bacterium]